MIHEPQFTRLEELLQASPNIGADFLDIITAIMKANNLQKVTIPPLPITQNERLCVLNRETFGGTPGYDIYLCESSEAAFAFGDSLYAADESKLN